MLKKASFTNQAAVITSLDPDPKSPWYDPFNYLTKYILFTTQDAHNFVPGSKVDIKGLYAAAVKGTALSCPILNATVYRVDSANTFVIEIPETFVEPTLGDSYMGFFAKNYYVNASGLGSRTTWNTFFTSAYGWNLYQVNPFVTARCSDGNLGAYEISYGDVV